MKDDEYKLVEKFIFNDEVQNILAQINSNMMDFNILEITGMGMQEIKHSNILSWLFGDNEHGVNHLVLEKFLKKVSDLSRNQDLKNYIYLSDKQKNITIYREKNNIDLMIVDDSNKLVLIIENKVYSNERVDGEDGGQLKKYEALIENNYKGYNKYFIYLTPNLSDASNDNWLSADYQMITDSLNEILQSNLELSVKAKMIFESYIYLLTRRGIVANAKIEELCKKIWSNREYRDALNVLFDNQPFNLEKIADIVWSKLEKEIGATNKELENAHSNWIFFKTESISNKLYKEGQIFYSLRFGYDGIFLAIYIIQENIKFDKLYKELFPSKSKRNYRNQLLSNRSDDWNDYVHDISIENLEKKIEDDLNSIIEKVKQCDAILKKYLK